MADLLVQNAVNSVKTAINQSSTKIKYSDALGKSLSQALYDYIVANPTPGDLYDSFLSPTGNLCQLSLISNISLANGCSYSGSTTSEVTFPNANNIWNNGTILKGSAEISLTQISTKMKTAIKALGQLTEISAAANTQISADIAFEYIGLQAKFTSENNTTVLSNWYGVNIVPNVAGAALSSTNKIKVCGTEWKYGQGKTQSWTVPDGATTAKFQVWGAGFGTNGACCCGGNPFGYNGSYAEMTVNVTPGESYNACAGCSCSRYCCSNSTPPEGCASGVTGPAICCLIATGSHCYNANCDNMNYLRCQIIGGACARFQSPACTQSGPCWCSYSEYCFDNSCATCGVIPIYPNCCYDYTCNCAQAARLVSDGPLNIVKGIHGGGCLDGNNYGYHIRPPIIDSDTGLLFTGGCQCMTFTSGTCCGGCSYRDHTYHPGHGGAGTHMMGGANNHFGDTGRGGMIQISWL